MAVKVAASAAAAAVGLQLDLISEVSILASRPSQDDVVGIFEATI